MSNASRGRFAFKVKVILGCILSLCFRKRKDRRVGGRRKGGGKRKKEERPYLQCQTHVFVAIKLYGFYVNKHLLLSFPKGPLVFRRL